MLMRFFININFIPHKNVIYRYMIFDLKCDTQNYLLHLFLRIINMRLNDVNRHNIPTLILNEANNTPPISNINNKLHEFILQIKTPTNSLKQSINKLKLQLNTTNINFNIIPQIIPLTTIQTHGAILAYITSEGEIPNNIHMVNNFLNVSGVNDFISQDNDYILEYYTNNNSTYHTAYEININHQ